MAGIEKLNESKLKKVLQYMLFEYSGPSQTRATAPGGEVSSGPVTYDKLAGNLGDDTVPSELPLEPSDMMAAQLATERPPVEDESYVPANKDELGKAASIISSMVDQKNIGSFYTRLKDLVDMDLDGQAEKAMVGQKEELEAKERANESYGGDGLLKVLSEVYGEEASLEDLAPVMGKSGASGVRQELERVMKRARYWAENASMQDIEMLKTVAVGKFIEGLMVAGFIDDDEAVELQQEPVAVKELPSFQFFFVNSMIMPSYRRLRKSAADGAMEVIGQLGIPLRSQQSYINMVMGDVPYSSRKLRFKIIKDAVAEGMDDREAAALALNAVNRYPDVKRSASMGTDFVENAVQYFNSINSRKLSTLIQTALESTQQMQSQPEE